MNNNCIFCKLANHVFETNIIYRLHADGYNIVQNNGETAGQTVFHFHIHLIPRYKDDGQLIGWKPGKPSAEELKALAEEIRLQ